MRFFVSICREYLSGVVGEMLEKLHVSGLLPTGDYHLLIRALMKKYTDTLILIHSKRMILQLTILLLLPRDFDETKICTLFTLR